MTIDPIEKTFADAANAPTSGEAAPTGPASATPANVEDVAALIKRLLTDYLQVNRPDFTEQIGYDMSFDYIGLDSLARVELLTALDRALGVSLDPTAAYDFVTVRALAEFVWSTLSGTAMDVKKALGI
jgi:acyl carrier protein